MEDGCSILFDKAVHGGRQTHEQDFVLECRQHIRAIGPVEEQEVKGDRADKVL